MDSNELKKREAKKKKLESELKAAEKNSLGQKKKFLRWSEAGNVVSGQKYYENDNRK